MPKFTSPRQLRADDHLYRKLNPDTWNPKTLEVFPEAFEDQHKDLSFFVGRMKGPRDVLMYFSQLRGLRKAFFGNESPRSPQELWERGFGIATIQVRDIQGLKLSVKTSSDGSEFSKEGHVDIVDGKRWSLEISQASVALSSTQVFDT